MANYHNRYMYETSPRKLKPEYNPPKKVKRRKNSTLKKKNDANIISKQNKKNESIKRKQKCIVYLLLAFAIFFAMGYQNSRINEQFSELKASEKQLASIQKENDQLKIAIQNNLNLGNLEQVAKEQLGMQKASTQQTRYVKLPKKDYVEVASEKIIKNPNENILDRIIEYVKNIVK